MSCRLDALLTRCGYGTRSEVKQLIRRRRVRIDGEVETSAKRQVEAQVVTVDGQTVERPPQTLHLVLHKPVGLSCSHDPDEAPLVYDLLPPLWQAAGVEAAGRLDRATSGLLLLSTDGQLLHSLIHPKRGLGKRYRVAYTGVLARDAQRRCAEGLRLLDDEQPCRPAELELHQPDADGLGHATLILHEGRYHQVRRMFQTLGAQVVGLHRDRIGQLDLPADLPPGHFRELTEAELNAALLVS
jgi:16S rRNA pseudouridine516 synthase